MAKKKQFPFICNVCNARFPKWIGQCTQCHTWNQILEDESRYGSNVVSMHNWLLRKAHEASEVADLHDDSQESEALEKLASKDDPSTTPHP